MLGTAPKEERYLLVEQEAGWSFGGFAELAIQEDIREEVAARAAAAGARVMLIRRPGRQSSSVCYLRAWCVVDLRAAAGERVTWGTWSYPAELLSGVERLEELQQRASETAPTATGSVSDGPGAPGSAADEAEELILICTHGPKDPCCAVRGRPVAVALAERWPEQTWECTHTGGDRFAANVILLPDGATYGGLNVDSALSAVETHRQGSPDLAHLRGAGGRSRAEQAAIVAVHDQLGPLPWGSVAPTGSVERALAEGTAAASTITLELADGRTAEVDVDEHDRPAALLSCRATAEKVSRVPVAGTVRLLADGAGLSTITG